MGSQSVNTSPTWQFCEANVTLFGDGENVHHVIRSRKARPRDLQRNNINKRSRIIHHLEKDNKAPRILCYGCFLKWWYSQNTPKWSFLVGKPMVVGYHHFRKPPYQPWQHTLTLKNSTNAYSSNFWLVSIPGTFRRVSRVGRKTVEIPHGYPCGIRLFNGLDKDSPKKKHVATKTGGQRAMLINHINRIRHKNQGKSFDHTWPFCGWNKIVETEA